MDACTAGKKNAPVASRSTFDKTKTNGSDYSTGTRNHTLDFALAIEASGLGSPSIIPDGDLHRFRVEGDRAGSRNGWYSLHLDGTPAGIFGSWKTSETHTWCATSRDEMTPADRARVRAIVDKARATREAEAKDRHQAAALKAQAMWSAASSADQAHQYLSTKGIQPHGIRQQGIALLVPVVVGGKLASIQSIYPDGQKRFLPGGRISGGYYFVKSRVTRPEILICEGFATGATLHQETGSACYVAFNAGNLIHVARHARSRHLDADIIVCADNDRWTAGNPGLTKAKAAAIEIGARLLVPDFSGMDLSGKPTDWNDWYALRRHGAEVAA